MLVEKKWFYLSTPFQAVRISIDQVSWKKWEALSGLGLGSLALLYSGDRQTGQEQLALEGVEETRVEREGRSIGGDWQEERRGGK